MECWSVGVLGGRAAFRTPRSELTCAILAYKNRSCAGARRLIFGASLELGFWCLVFMPSPPQFIRPTVPRPVNIDDFACFIRPNVRPKPSHDPSHPSQGEPDGYFRPAQCRRCVVQNMTCKYHKNMKAPANLRQVLERAGKAKRRPRLRMNSFNGRIEDVSRVRKPRRLSGCAPSFARSFGGQ
jgi:hypothetical protein